MPTHHDIQINTLLALSQAMYGALARQQFDLLEGFVEERGKLVRELTAAAGEGQLDATLAQTLEQAWELGERSRLPLMTRRETAREDLKLLRRRRQNQQALKPASTTASRLNVQG